VDEPQRAAKSPPAFSDDSRREIALGKYTNWAADLTEEQLAAVLWAVGEFGRRSQPVLDCLARHEGEFYPAGGYPRARLGLKLLAAMADRKGFSVGEVIERVQATVREWRASLEMPQDEMDA
jgi:hypothetical protein